MRELPLDTPLYEILGARAPLLRQFEKIGIKTAGDLLRHFPSRYEDYSKIYSIAELEPGQQATIQAAIEDIKLRRTRRGFAIVEAVLADESGTVRAIWFNQPYIANTLRAGRIANFAGKVSLSEEGDMYLNGPAYEILKAASDPRYAGGFGEASEGQGTSIHTARLVPIYPETRGLTSRGIRFAVRLILKRNPEITEWIPASVLSEFSLPEAHRAMQSVHFPKHIEDAMAAQKRFSFENLFLLQLFNLEQKQKLNREKAPVIPPDIERVKAILAELPFELTQSQKQSLWEIIQDIAKPKPMNRLLQGDVGSGKTIVAAIAAILAAERGYQAAFMAPTEILARQHFETIKELFKRIGGKRQPIVGFITGTAATIFYDNDLESKVSKKELHAKAADGTIAIIFGTHALIQKTVSFKNLGLVIVDEQHRFGVRQRAALAERKSTLTPHFLSMSATPIPRTLMLTVFGDLDLSLIAELPAGRKPIETKIVPPLERQSAYGFVRTEIKSGRQVFVICPRIEPQANTDERLIRTDKSAVSLELKSVKEEFEKLSKKVFPDLRIAMLHGQMKPHDKEKIMRDFNERKFDVLVATSVVEVGVDVPNATIMMIEGADRFGLAQLYQFRGRVGRGGHQSYCFLMSETPGETAKARLQAILKAKNGFELAEYDLKLRGPGEFFGSVQTGFPDELMQALQNPELVKESRAAAIAAVQADPTFARSPQLRKKLSEFRKKVHRE
jgi:ATP-dependent DNA helicase RecG